MMSLGLNALTKFKKSSLRMYILTASQSITCRSNPSTLTLALLFVFVFVIVEEEAGSAEEGDVVVVVVVAAVALFTVLELMLLAIKLTTAVSTRRTINGGVV